MRTLFENFLFFLNHPITEAGFLGAGDYFKAAYLLLAAFYDKSLGPYERAENAWTSFTFFTLWAEHSKKYNLSDNMLTRQTLNDVLTTANGLILYLVGLIKYPKAPVVPWYLHTP